jgi:hypothetical protein
VEQEKGYGDTNFTGCASAKAGIFITNHHGILFPVERFTARGFAFFIPGMHKHLNGTQSAGGGGRCGLTRAVAGCEGMVCGKGRQREQP